jgi:ribosome recycling factor
MLFDEKEARVKMQRAIDRFLENLKKISTGKVDIETLQKIEIEAYGTMTPLQSLGKVIVENAVTAFIDVFDRSILVNVEKALKEANLGASIVPQGQNRIKIAFNPMTEEDRKEKLPQLKKMAEEIRVEVREVRHQIKKDIDEMSSVSEDDQRSSLEKLQKIVDEFINQINEITKRKEEDLLTI